MKQLFHWFCLLGSPLLPSTAARAQSIFDAPVLDKNYVEDFAEIASLRLLVANRNFNLGLKNRVGDQKLMQYDPNVQGIYGFEAYYRKFGVELSFALPASRQETLIYGRTRFFDAQVNSYGNRLGYDLNLQTYRGMYHSNPGDFLPGWSVQGGYPQRPDLRAFVLGTNVYYVFNAARFSYPAVFTHTERQKRSAGSWLAAASFFHINLTADTTLYPAPRPYQQNNAFEDGVFNLLAAGPGYAYAFVIADRYYVTPSLMVGVSVRQQGTRVDEHWDSGLGMGTKLNFRLAAGYYGKQFFGGLTLVSDHNWLNVQNVQVRTGIFNARAFVGYRFNRLFGRRVQSPFLDRYLGQ